LTFALSEKPIAFNSRRTVMGDTDFN